MARCRTRTRRRRARPAQTVVLSLLAALLPLAPTRAQQAAELPPAIDPPSCFATAVTEIPEGRAQIVDARDPEQVTMGSHAIVDVAPGNLTLEPGMRLQIVRLEGPIDPPMGEYIGEAIRVVGELEITDVGPTRAVARVVDACSEVQIGDWVQPLVDREIFADIPQQDFDPGQLVEPSGEDALVAYGDFEAVPDEEGGIRSRWERLTYATGDVVTIDRGTASGWSAGDEALLYQYGPLHGDPPSFGDDSVVLLGRAVAIMVQRNTAALLITAGDRAVRVGARARRLPAE